MSPCGTFAVIGSATGSIDMYNLQSGIKRARFPPPLTSKQAERLKMKLEEETVSAEPYYAPKKFARGQGKHTKAVTGIAIDSLNRTVVSCGEDGKLKFWDFSSGVLLHQLDWAPMVSIKTLRYHRSSDLIALACDDSSIRLVDIETKKVVRELFCPAGQITDFTFSNDSRWIVASTSESLICVWDLPTGHLIDAMKLRSQCTALAFSHTGEYLATAQEDSVGVSIWTNRTLFTHVPTKQISEKDVAEIQMPTASGEGGQGLLAAANVSDDEEDAEEFDIAPPSVDQLNASMTTLSLVPKSRWQNLLHLDLIRERNRPTEGPKKPEKAPFFLPSLNPQSTSQTDSATSNAQDLVPLTSASTSISRIAKSSLLSNAPDVFTRILTAFASENSTVADPEPVTTHLSALPPSAADITIRSLTPTEIPIFISALTARLRQRKDYELVQAWINVCLKVHGETIVGDEDSIEMLREWRSVQEGESKRLGRLVGYCNGVVSYLRSAR